MRFPNGGARVKSARRDRGQKSEGYADCRHGAARHTSAGRRQAGLGAWCSRRARARRGARRGDAGLSATRSKQMIAQARQQPLLKPMRMRPTPQSIRDVPSQSRVFLDRGGRSSACDERVYWPLWRWGGLRSIGIEATAIAEEIEGASEMARAVARSLAGGKVESSVRVTPAHRAGRSAKVVAQSQIGNAGLRRILKVRPSSSLVNGGYSAGLVGLSRAGYRAL